MNKLCKIFIKAFKFHFIKFNNNILFLDTYIIIKKIKYPYRFIYFFNIDIKFYLNLLIINTSEF